MNNTKFVQYLVELFDLNSQVELDNFIKSLTQEQMLDLVKQFEENYSQTENKKCGGKLVNFKFGGTVCTACIGNKLSLYEKSKLYRK